MPATFDIPAPLHREITPARSCASCDAWLTSANEDDYCYQCGGWTTQRLSALEALGEVKRISHSKDRERVGAAFEELMTA